MERLDNLGLTVTDLNAKVRIVEDENANLMSTIHILQSELINTNEAEIMQNATKNDYISQINKVQRIKQTKYYEKMNLNDKRGVERDGQQRKH